MAGFLTELHVQGFGCLKDVKCKLTPLHALIGPNDSGKSTMLRAIQTLCTPAYRGDFHVYARFSDSSDLRVNQGAPGLRASLPGSPQILALHDLQLMPRTEGSQSRRTAEGRERAEMVRLNADDLRKPSPLIQHGANLSLQGRGENVAGLYDALRDRSVERFSAISRRVSDLFPTVRELGLRALASNTKVLAVTLVDGTEVLSDGMSEGLLYFLAFAILSELQRPAVYLVEEPENGLHPSRIADIVHMLRAITEDAANPVQVIMATHSPLVVNELRPEEVTVVTRDPAKGTELRPIKNTPNFEARSKVYALGELWLSYANGKDEAPLFSDQGP
jgi:predicted ATPase